MYVIDVVTTGNYRYTVDLVISAYLNIREFLILALFAKFRICEINIFIIFSVVSRPNDSHWAVAWHNVAYSAVKATTRVSNTIVITSRRTYTDVCTNVGLMLVKRRIYMYHIYQRWCQGWCNIQLVGRWQGTLILFYTHTYVLSRRISKTVLFNHWRRPIWSINIHIYDVGHCLLDLFLITHDRLRYTLLLSLYRYCG